jgi:hypothetical protein
VGGTKIFFIFLRTKVAGGVWRRMKKVVEKGKKIEEIKHFKKGRKGWVGG